MIKKYYLCKIKTDNMKREFFLKVVGIALMSVSTLDSAAQPGSEQLSETAFKKLGIANGLHSNSVTTLLADSRGYLWIGTSLGLCRYDGHQVKTRFPESSNQQFHEVFHQPITSIEEDARGYIWIECESGTYYLYDTQTAQFSNNTNHVLQTMGIRNNGKYKVKVGRKGVVWVLTGSGIYCYDYHSKELKKWERRLLMPGLTAKVVAEMSDGLYFCSGHEVWHFLSSTGELQRETLPEMMQQTVGEYCVTADADGTLWIYSTREEHICRYIVGGRREREMVQLPQTAGSSQNNAIRDMIDDGRGNIWIATDHKGLFAYNKNTGTVYSMRYKPDRPLSLASDNVTCLTADRNGTIWAGHLKTGLSYTSKANNIMTAHARQCGDILAMAYDTGNNLWMGTDGDGIYIERSDGTTMKTAFPNITVMTLTSDGQGGMWVGTYNQGLYHMADAKRWKR